jgi:hypothetical protein
MFTLYGGGGGGGLCYIEKKILNTWTPGIIKTKGNVIGGRGGGVCYFEQPILNNFCTDISGQPIGPIFKGQEGLLDPWRWDQSAVPKRR